MSPSGAFINVSSYTPPSVYGTLQSAGQMRYNTNTQQIEVYDGNSWISISQTATVGLNYEAEEAIRWVQKKMSEERELKARMERHPGLKDAYEKFQIMDILTREEDEQVQR